jgi:hypothetical protein
VGIRLAFTAGALAAALAAGISGCATNQAPAATRAVVVVLENRELGEVIGNPEAPFINRLARRGSLAERYFGVTHPSLPNYLALLGGSTFGVKEDCVDCSFGGPNLGQQLSARGISWRAYMEGMPEPCFQGSEAGPYVKRHNPFLYFRSISERPGRCARVVPISRLGADLLRSSLPAFAWIQPGLCHGGHDCDLRTVDDYVRGLLPPLERRLAPNGFLVLTFDEGTSDRGCCGSPGGGRVATILVGPRVRSGARLRQTFDQYSLLATIEDAFGLPRLRHARGATTLRAAFEPGAGRRGGR